jgi:hypothetical protein
MTDARREAVARLIWFPGDNVSREQVIDGLLAWHEAETRTQLQALRVTWEAKDTEARALREAGLQFVAEIMPRYREMFEAANLGVFLDSVGNQEARKFLALLTPTPGAGKA